MSQLSDLKVFRVEQETWAHRQDTGLHLRKQLTELKAARRRSRAGVLEDKLRAELVVAAAVGIGDLFLDTVGGGLLELRLNGLAAGFSA